MQPTRAGYINAIQVYPFSDGALYQVYAAPGEITDIALEAGRAARRLRPRRRRRHRALDHRRHRERDRRRPSASTSWSSRRGRISSPTSSSTPTGAPIISSCARTRRPTWRRCPGLCRRTSSSRCASRTPPPTRRRPIATGVDINALNFRYRIEGDNPAWRPLRAFDDGRQVFIEFPTGIGQGEMPPLWVIGAAGRRRARQLPRPGQPHDRRSAVRRGRAAARRRSPAEGSHRPHRREAAVVTDAPHEEAAGPPDGDRPPQEMRLRSEPGARHAALPQGAARPRHGRGHRDRRRAVPRSPAAAPDDRLRTLQHQQSHDAGWPRQSAARLYGPAETRSPARPAASRRSRPADRQCRRAGARHADTGPGSRAAAHRPGAGGGAHQPSLRDDQRRTGRARGHRRHRPAAQAVAPRQPAQPI